MSFRDLIDDALAGNGADYCEVRIEETDSTRLTWRGKSLEDIAQTSGRGGNVPGARERRMGFRFLQRPDRTEEARRRRGEPGPRRQRRRQPLRRCGRARRLDRAAAGQGPGRNPARRQERQMDSYNDVIWSVDGIQSSDMIYGTRRGRSTSATPTARTSSKTGCT